jgi:hypothetical protein
MNKIVNRILSSRGFFQLPTVSTLATVAATLTSSIRLIALVLIVGFLGACTRTVTWEEEVPLNTGETIWVTRSMRLVLKGAGGNPMDVGIRPDFSRTISFEYKGKSYKYEGTASVIVLAISPNGQPVLIANAQAANWAGTHGYFPCKKPNYVQLSLDSTGKKWTWPPVIETWTYGLPKNLTFSTDKLVDGPVRITSKDRQELDRHAPRSRLMIDPTYIFEHCKERK